MVATDVISARWTALLVAALGLGTASLGYSAVKLSDLAAGAAAQSALIAVLTDEVRALRVEQRAELVERYRTTDAVRDLATRDRRLDTHETRIDRLEARTR